jgi:hypothetical protein
MNGRTWAVFIVIVVAVIGGMVYMAKQDKLDVSDVGKDKAAGVLAAEDRNGNIEEHVLGKKDAKLIIVEYGDYQCPGCSTAAPKAKAVAESSCTKAEPKACTQSWLEKSGRSAA